MQRETDHGTPVHPTTGERVPKGWVPTGQSVKRLAITLYTTPRDRDRRNSRNLQVLTLAQWQRLTSDEQFSVDGTPIQAWVSPKSFIDFDEEAGHVIDAMDRLDRAIACL